jgi:oligoendopeptidase F
MKLYLVKTESNTLMSLQTSAAGIAWDLSDLFASVDDPAIKQRLEEVDSQAQVFAQTYRGKINVDGGPAANLLLEALQQLEIIYDTLNRPAAYSFLLFAADTSKPAHRNLQQYVEQRLTEITNKLIFFNLEWLEVADGDAERLMADPLLATYVHHLQSTRRYKPHTLSEPEEQVINEKDVTGKQAWQNLFTELIASLSFPFQRDGETEHLPLDVILSQRMRDPDRAVRQQAHTVLFDVLGKQAQTLAFVYNTLMLDHLTMDRLRVYPDPMMVRHLSNEIAPETVATMMDTVEQNYPLAQDYFTLKAKLLNLPRLQTYDQYAPIDDKSIKMSYAEGQALILEAFASFSSTFHTIANDFFTGNWIDAEIREGKRGGAFCSGFTPHHHPYVLCNYTDDMRDVMTVAHELGHGIHFSLSRKQTMLNYYSTLPLAETASVFAEMLVFDHMLKQQQDSEAKLALVCGKIEDIFATIFRQNVLTRFEQSAFAGRANERLTPEQLGEYWIDANSRYYGEAVECTPGYEFGWSYIPHFIHTPFYCYSYVFGELLVLALYGLYREQGEAFVPGYTRLLESGGSKTPDEMLSEIGIDTRDPAFWQRGFEELRRLVAQAQQLAAECGK